VDHALLVAHHHTDEHADDELQDTDGGRDDRHRDVVLGHDR
jgi:hypothetical protein